MRRSLSIILTLLTVLAVLATPLHAMAMSHDAGDDSIAVAHTHHHDGPVQSNCGGGTGDASFEPCLDCTTCAPALAGSMTSTLPPAGMRPLLFDSQATGYRPPREQRPPRNLLV